MREAILSFLAARKNTFFQAGRVFSPLYASAMSLRARCYSQGIFRTRKVEVPVISVGNISMGGTGKTPHVMALCKFLKARSWKPAVVTRGYDGKAGKGPLVVSDGNVICANASSAGDEPFMLANEMPDTIIVAGSDRYQGANRAIELGADIIVLDDGFQHMSLHRDMDIVLLPLSSPLGKVFPGGELREPISALERADSIVVTGCERKHDYTPLHIKKILSQLGIKAKIFESRNRTGFLKILSLQHGFGLENDDFSNWKQARVFAFCGIGKPQAFLHTLETGPTKEIGWDITGHHFFRDHHCYSDSDILMLLDSARNAGASAIVTTAKDAVKIGEILETMNSRSFQNKEKGDILPILVLQIEAVPEQEFWKDIEDRLHV